MEPLDCYLGLGANLGERARQMAEALASLSWQPEVELVDVSPVYESAPEGGADQPPYLNLVALVRAWCSPERLLALCREVEEHLGRQRPYPGAPRTIDLDLLLCGEESRQTETLTLPHPRMLQRGFVLVPLADLAPDLRVAGTAPVRELAAACQNTVRQIGPLRLAVKRGL